MNSPMREAFLKAADHIERHPSRFDFLRVRVPVSPRDCGCALGWVGYFYGLRDCSFGEILRYIHPERANSDWSGLDRAFYNAMAGGRHYWQQDAALCAQRLRAYADQHFPFIPEVPKETIAEMLRPFRTDTLPVWAALRDREAIYADARSRAYGNFRRGLARILARPTKEAV